MTAQESEWIFYKGENRVLLSQPLKPFLDAQTPPLRWLTQSTSNWRGYVGHWTVEHDRLALVSIEGLIADEADYAEAFDEKSQRSSRWLYDRARKASVDRIFGRHEVVADWFTGTLTIVAGELVEYVHMDFFSSYSRYIALEIVEGRLVSEQILGSQDLWGSVALKRN